MVKKEEFKLSEQDIQNNPLLILDASYDVLKTLYDNILKAQKDNFSEEDYNNFKVLILTLLLQNTTNRFFVVFAELFKEFDIDPNDIINRAQTKPLPDMEKEFLELLEKTKK